MLQAMIPETLAFAPLGIGIVPYGLPSSEELAKDTLEQIKTNDVVLWEKHGTVAVGQDNMSSEPDGMTPEAMKEVQDVFNLPKTRPC